MGRQALMSMEAARFLRGGRDVDAEAEAPAV